MNNNTLPIAKEGIIYIVTLLILGIIFYFLFIPIFILNLSLLLFVILFFRNPSRKIPLEDSVIVSPADGKVISVEEIIEPDFISGKAIKVSIFLSIFNVHINRSPIDGVVKYLKYRPGKYLPAFKSHASEINERNSVGIENDTVKVLVHQITGFIARRIVCRLGKGDSVDKGQRFGMIKFGSCTEIVVPMSVFLKVKVGDKLKAGSSIIGTIQL